LSDQLFSTRPFGVEFEIGNEVTQGLISNVIKSNSNYPVEVTSSWGQSINNNYWHVKYDSTCGANGKKIDHGWEIASFKASGLQELKHIAAVAVSLRNAGCLVNTNCGFHIHADVSDFTKSQMGLLLARWLKIEPFICNAVPFSRVNNYFCRLISKHKILDFRKKYKPTELWDVLKPCDFNIHDNVQKKVTLNTVNFAQSIQNGMSKHTRNTIELRMPEGTLDSGNVEGWVGFFVNFVDHSKTTNISSNLSSVNSLKKFFLFAGLSNDRIVANRNLLNVKLWFVKRFYKFGSLKIKNEICKGNF